MPFCRNCGKSVGADDRFCAACGSPQESENLSIPSPPPPLTVKKEDPFLRMDDQPFEIPLVLAVLVCLASSALWFPFGLIFGLSGLFCAGCALHAGSNGKKEYARIWKQRSLAWAVLGFVAYALWHVVKALMRNYP